LYLLYIYFKSFFVIYRYIIYVPLIENIFMKIMFEYFLSMYIWFNTVKAPYKERKWQM